MHRREVIQRRLTSQGLLDSRFEAVEDVMEWMVAVQAQERAVAPWSLGQRTRNAVETDVRDALTNGSILRTHLLRPTWHYISNADIGWLLDLVAPRVHGVNGPYYRKLELDPSLLATCSDLLARALEGHRHHTRVELQRVLEANGVFSNGMRMSYVLMHAELEKVVCSGAPRGKHHTYALFDERVGARRSLSNDEALAELTLRFFRSRGPATLKDYCLWSSLTVRQAKRGLDQVRDSLESREMDGLTCWMASDFGAVATSRHQVHLLQGYDEYFASYGETRGFTPLLRSRRARRAERVRFFTSWFSMDRSSAAGSVRCGRTTRRSRYRYRRNSPALTPRHSESPRQGTRHSSICRSNWSTLLRQRFKRRMSHWI